MLTSEKFDCLVDIARHRIINGRGFEVDGEPSKAWLLAVKIAKEKEWKANMTPEERTAKWKDIILGKLVADQAADLSDKELDRCLGQCVSPQMLVLGRQYRASGIIVEADLESKRRQ